MEKRKELRACEALSCGAVPAADAGIIAIEATIAAADIPARILEIFIVNLLHMNIVL